jgi:hypothetical protein
MVSVCILTESGGKGKHIFSLGKVLSKNVFYSCILLKKALYLYAMIKSGSLGGNAFGHGCSFPSFFAELSKERKMEDLQ